MSADVMSALDAVGRIDTMLQKTSDPATVACLMAQKQILTRLYGIRHYKKDSDGVTRNVDDGTPYKAGD